MVQQHEPLHWLNLNFKHKKTTQTDSPVRCLVLNKSLGDPQHCLLPTIALGDLHIFYYKTYHKHYFY